MKRVLILGATSAVASEVACLHARRGDRLHLVGRNQEKLVQLQARITAASASCKYTSTRADFSNLDAAEETVREAIQRLGGLDTVLIAHGELSDQLATEAHFADAEYSLRVNFLSVVAFLIPIANHMELERRGSIGVITSVAGDRGRPRNYTYGTAKGALNIYLQGLRTRLYAANVRVTTLKLGPVDSPMTASHAKHALFGKPAQVAKGIVRSMDAGTAEAYVPAVWGAIMSIVKNTPESLIQRLPFLSGR
jgi:decaprenylphospho-beta-D-erythro-pentofuranosid-2-ulose 2-reductase